MKFRNAIQAIFGNLKEKLTSAWREIGNYTSYFSSFGTDVYANDTVRACIRTLAEHTSKANVKVFKRTGKDRIEGDPRLQRMIQYRPNMYMNGKDFLYKCRTLYEINNVLFIYIQRDEFGKCVGLYPMPQGQLEAVEDTKGNLFIKFKYQRYTMVHAWDDLAVLRKDYNTSDIWGDSNDAILTSLNLLTTTNDGMANAIKSTANLRGILKSTKAMLSDDDIKKNKDRFVTDYMSMTNTSGIASLDATQEFTPLTMTPFTASYKTIEDLRLNIYRYFGMNEDVVMSKATADVRESFYESKIETFLLALSLELTYKVYNPKQLALGNEILFEANRMAYMSQAEKINLVQMVDRGAMTPNEWREAMNLAPIEGGDVPIRRLDTAPTTQLAESVKEEPDDNEGQTV